MLKNYLKIGYRNLSKDLNYSLINLLGLSMGLAVFIIMIMIVHHEYTFDHFHKKGNRLFEVVQEFQNNEGADPEIHTSMNLSKALREELPMVENAVTVHSAASTWVEVQGKRFFEEEGIVAGPQFFDMFDFELKQGVKNQVLTHRNSIVLEENLALKLFGSGNPIGEVIELERYGFFTVTGILEPIPANSFIRFNYIITQDYEVFFKTVAPWFPQWFQSWEGDPAATFVLLHDPVDSDHFPQQVSTILQKHADSDQTANPHYLINLFDLHFGLNGIDGRVNEYVKGNIRQIHLFELVAFLILFLACFNYINLSISRSMKRTKEVGVRKSMGALKPQIKSQFLIESSLHVFFAFVLAIGWIYLLIPYFVSISEINLRVTLVEVMAVLPFVLLMLAMVTIGAGFYPALFLSNFSPVKVLKKSAFSDKATLVLRNGLMIIQYGLVIVMVTFLFIVQRQYQYLNENELGFDTEQLVIIEINGGGVRSNYISLKNELLANPKITKVTGMTRMISGYRSSAGIWALHPDNPELRYAMKFYGMDEDGLSTLGFDLKHGENFSGTRTMDSTSVFLNETAANLYGGEQVIGEMINLTDVENELLYAAKVIGIIGDFHYQSLHEPIGPVVVGYYLNPIESLDDIVIKVATGNFNETLGFIESVHNKFDENDVMTWEFMDDMTERSYQQELIFRDVFLGASGISLIISLLGIVGLISFNVMAKTREFGIRKVLGASYVNLLSLQGGAFLKYLFIAMAIVSPISWWLASNWLVDYAYRIELSATPFVFAFTIVLICTVTSIWLVLHKSVSKNPVEAIRYE